MTLLWLLLLFILGWSTQTLTLFDIGRYSFPLILFAGLPFCLKLTYRSTIWLALPVASLLFTICVAGIQGVQLSHIVSQSVLQLLAIFFAAGVAAVEWRKHTRELELALSLTGIPIVLYACYQMLARVAHLPGAFLPVTNKQYYIEGGLQRDWDKADVTRASSVFSEPSELGFFCLWLLVIGLASKNTRVKLILLVSSWIGILVSQSLSAFLGALVIGVAYCLLQGISTRMLRQAFFGALLCVGIVLAIKPLVPEAYASFSKRIEEAATFDDRADSGRVDHLPACIAIFQDSPIWGHGISSLAAAGSDGADVTTINYVMVLMERGIVGSVLFFGPWFLMLARAWLLPRGSQDRTLTCLLMVMTLYSFCDFSLTYFLPFWFAFGIAASLTLKTYLPQQRGVIEATDRRRAVPVRLQQV